MFELPIKVLLPVQPRLTEHRIVCQEHLYLSLSHVGNLDMSRVGCFCASQGGQILHHLHRAVERLYRTSMTQEGSKHAYLKKI